MGNLVLGLAISGPSVERTIKTVDKPVLIATGIGTDEDYKHPPMQQPWSHLSHAAMPQGFKVREQTPEPTCKVPSKSGPKIWSGPEHCIWAVGTFVEVGCVSRLR